MGGSFIVALKFMTTNVFAFSQRFFSLLTPEARKARLFFIKNGCISFALRRDVSKDYVINVAEHDLNGSKRTQMILAPNEASLLEKHIDRIHQNTKKSNNGGSTKSYDRRFYEVADKKEILHRDHKFLIRVNANHSLGNFLEILHNHQFFGVEGPITLPLNDINQFKNYLTTELKNFPNT